MIVVAAVWGPSLFHIIVVIGLTTWPMTARVIRSEVKTLRERTHIKRLETLGASHPRVVGRHVLPHLAPLIVANTVLTIAAAVFAETALSFLGLGDPSSISWGKLIENAFQRTALSAGAWWVFVPPGVCVAAVVLACTLVGQGLDDALNPRLRTMHLSGMRFKRLVLPERESGPVDE
jgi:peptide/nickel transport system permease protein